MNEQLMLKMVEETDAVNMPMLRMQSKIPCLSVEMEVYHNLGRAS